MPKACAIGARSGRVIFSLSVLVVLWTGFPTRAQTVLDIHTGTAQALLSPDHQPWALGLDLGVGARIRLSDQWRLRVHVDWRRLWNDTTTNAVVKLPKPDDKAANAWTQASYALAAERRIGILDNLAPFAGLGLGVMSWKVESYPGYGTVEVEDGKGEMRDYSADELYLLGIAGIEPRLFSRVHLRVEAGFNFLTGLGADFSGPINDDRSHAQFTLAFGIAIPLTSHTGHVPPKGPVTPPRYSADTTKSTPPVAQKPPAQKPNEPEKPKTTTQEDNAPDTTTRQATQPPVDTTRHVPSPATTAETGPEIKPMPDTAQSAKPAAPVSAALTPALPEDSLHDSDADGVNDAVDKCPNTPQLPGLVVDATGCPVDTDGDGVPDYLDACLDTPKGAYVNTLGCTPDTDGDGVTDDRDKCPDTPSGLDVDPDGCLIMTELQRRLILHVIYISGTTDPDPMSQRILDDLAVRLVASPNTEALIEGFTDNIGDALANLNVSQKRANKIKEYLISRGVKPERLNAIGRGETRFIADNSNAAGREKNRRIEISFRRVE